MCLLWIADVALFDGLWFDDDDAEIRAGDFVVEVLDFCGEFEGGVVGGVFGLAWGWVFP